MKIKWVRLALADLDQAAEFISQDNPEAAKRIVKRIRDAARLLSDQPNAGRPGRVHGTRELVITDTPFILPYRVVSNTVQILRVLHGARKWPEQF
ncbi:MAG: type II toxin-antitoxin system RelE/ParE family toxin [Desulfobacteraceae bacterium]|jgi:toxin ParE1/3/4|nr:type II toxin-antitoxin system RelE/ParE family toxin [Desulfobacteraceae bacterium]